ncbi:unnamed protein product [Boreogadus saida]
MFRSRGQPRRSDALLVLRAAPISHIPSQLNGCPSRPVESIGSLCGGHLGDGDSERHLEETLRSTAGVWRPARAP